MPHIFILSYCANGPYVKNRPPLLWAPSSSHLNSWILVGTTDGDPTSTCKTHEELRRADAKERLSFCIFVHVRCISVGKVGVAAMVVFAFHIHPQLPLWILEGLLVVGATLTIMYNVVVLYNHDVVARTKFY